MEIPRYFSQQGLRWKNAGQAETVRNAPIAGTAAMQNDSQPQRWGLYSHHGSDFYEKLETEPWWSIIILPGVDYHDMFQCRAVAAILEVDMTEIKENKLGGPYFSSIWIPYSLADNPFNSAFVQPSHWYSDFLGTCLGKGQSTISIHVFCLQINYSGGV